MRPEETVFSRLQATVSRCPGAPAFQVLDETAQAYGIDAGEITYAQILSRVEVWAEQFRTAGFGPGHRVGLLLENRPVFLEIWWALNSLGASIVPINPDLRLAELEYLIGHSEMVAAIALTDRVNDLKDAAALAGAAIPIVALGGDIPAVKRANEAPLNSQTECALLYTSGTTGRPKGCILTNEYFLHSGDWYAETGGLIALHDEGERMLTPLPLFHMNALAVSVMAMITVGGCLIALDRFHPRSWWASVRESRASIVHYLGVMPPLLMGAEPAPADQDHSVRFGFGAGVDRKLHAPFEERFGFPLIEAWACTETGSGATISAHEEPRKIGTACFGRPTPQVEVQVVDDQGAPVPAGSPGELLVRRAGENPRYGFCAGYLKDPEATEELWKGGWLNTGDVVTQDEDGSLHFVDRKKNVIRRSGENIAAVEVEMILNRHTDVRLAAAVAIPDEIRGDEVGAFIILDLGAGDAAQAQQITDWAREQMAYYKVPGWVAFVDALPVTATQKLQRGEIKALAEAAMSEGRFTDLRHLKKRAA